MIIANAKKGKGVYDEQGGRDASSEKKMQGMNSTLFNFIASKVGTSMNKMANSSSADEATSPCLSALDISGYNYASGRYPKEGECHPQRLIYGSETFPQDIAKNWEMVKKYPYLVGDFMWTAWDYIGEVGIGAWAYTKDGTGFNKPYPWLLAETGALDIIGTPNGEMLHAQAVWDLLNNPAIAVQPVNHPGQKHAKMVWRGTNAIPSWSWQDCEGNKAVVEVYCNAASVELLLNGKRVGKARVKDSKAIFKTKYATGSLCAVSYDESGNEIGRSELCSAAGNARPKAVPEQETAALGEVVFVWVSLVGENGVVESNADRLLKVKVDGGTLLGFGSANPRTEESYNTGSFTSYYGRALAAVRADSKRVCVTVSDDMGNQDTAEISAK